MNQTAVQPPPPPPPMPLPSPAPTLVGIDGWFIAFTKRICSTKAPDLSNKISAAIVLFLIGATVIGLICLGISSISDSQHTNKPDDLTSAERLAKAKTACGNGSECLDKTEAEYQISKIPTSAPEYAEASGLLISIERQAKSQSADAVSGEDGAKQRSYDQMQRNFQGQANDNFVCTTSTESTPIVSFDGGTYWWKDDGRCAAKQQAKKDEDAQIYSYWSTVVRVNSDMDSSWLADEERTCKTYPDEKGKVATVSCNATSPTDHNIPVTFWGGVNRNTISDWKCRREKDFLDDRFVCRAVD